MKFSIERQKTATEIAEEIDALFPDNVRAYHMKEYVGMMISTEVQKKWLNPRSCVLF